MNTLDIKVRLCICPKTAYYFYVHFYTPIKSYVNLENQAKMHLVETFYPVWNDETSVWWQQEKNGNVLAKSSWIAAYENDTSTHIITDIVHKRQAL